MAFFANAEAVLFFVFGQSFASQAGRRTAEILEGPRKRKRSDVPRPQTSAGGSSQKALDAAQPANREHTMQQYQQDVWANSSRASQDARLRTLESVASAWTISLTPVTKDVVDKIAAALKSGG